MTQRRSIKTAEATIYGSGLAMSCLISDLVMTRDLTRGAIWFALLLSANRVFAQSAPASPDRPWHAPQGQEIEDAAKHFHESGFSIEPDRTYTLAELVDLAATHNPETRVAWERARAQAAALGVARSELYPTVAAVALSQVNQQQVLFGNSFFRQTVENSGPALQLSYTVFDSGARAGRIAAARAELVAADFAFNDTHRRII